MTRLSQNTAMGIAIVLLSLLLLARDQWFLTETPKGKRLVNRFGPGKALWIFRGLLGLLAIVGGLLAADVIRPLKW